MYTCIYHTAWTSRWTGRLILVSFHTYEQRFSLNLCGVFQEDVHSISTLDSKFQTVSGNDSDFILKVEQKALRVPWWGRFHHDLGSGEVPPDRIDKGFWWSMGCETSFFCGLGWPGLNQTLVELVRCCSEAFNLYFRSTKNMGSLAAEPGEMLESHIWRVGNLTKITKNVPNGGFLVNNGCINGIFLADV